MLGKVEGFTLAGSGTWTARGSGRQWGPVAMQICSHDCVVSSELERNGGHAVAW
jgi:hypothetical protein